MEVTVTVHIDQKAWAEEYGSETAAQIRESVQQSLYAHYRFLGLLAEGE